MKRIGGSTTSPYEVARRFNARERRVLALEGAQLVTSAQLNTQFKVRRMLVSDPNLPRRSRKQLRRDVRRLCSADGIWVTFKIYLETTPFAKSTLATRGVSLDFGVSPITEAGLADLLDAAYAQEAAVEEAHLEALRRATGAPTPQRPLDAEVQRAKDDLLGEATCRGRIARIIESLFECNLVYFPKAKASKRRRDPIKIIKPTKHFAMFAEEIAIGALALSTRASAPLFAEAQKSSAAKSKLPRVSGGKK
jgi:hypothetical protein